MAQLNGTSYWQEHPQRYLAALASLVGGGGSHVFEHTDAEEVTGDPWSVKAGGHTIRCDYVVVALRRIPR